MITTGKQNRQLPKSKEREKNGANQKKVLPECRRRFGFIHKRECGQQP
jgi:hypothetical protein